MSIETRIKESLDKMADGWQRGDGKLFAQPSSKEAHFVAFDGSIHHGPDEIAAFHQRAFDTVLKGTSLELEISEIKQIEQKIWLVFSKARLHGARGRAPSPYQHQLSIVPASGE
jgi:uncharacterized protein (TIGR02246 family)